jgi:hypothetical protein
MTRSLLAGTAALALLFGCAHSPTVTESSPPAPAVHAPGPTDAMMATCPMAVPGTEVSATDAAKGETITFTTKDQVTELRSRVREMAAIHNQYHLAGTTPQGMLGGEMMSPSFATVIDVENGSSILLTPSHPADLQKLQAEVRMRAHRMRLNGCGMMEQARGS